MTTDEAIAAAVAAEREACAQVAWMIVAYSGCSRATCETASRVAAAIRARAPVRGAVKGDCNSIERG